MLVQLDHGPERPTSALHSIMDSPTLARVERAMLRERNMETVSLNRSVLSQSLMPPSFSRPDPGYQAIKRGLLWQQRDRLFSRWKERYFILTRDYLHCFRRASGSDRISEMGQFLFKVKLVDVEKVEWVNKKTYSTVALELGRDGKILLRSSDGLEDWFELLEECTLTSKERRRALRHSQDSTRKRQDNNNSINASLDLWLRAREKIPAFQRAIDNAASPRDEDTVVRRERKRDLSIGSSDTWTIRDHSDNRLSLLTDIDISSYGGDSTLGTPSVASFRVSEDVICVRRPTNSAGQDSVSVRGSFRGHRVTAPPAPVYGNIGSANRMVLPQQFIKYRERSHSDIQRIDRRQWRPRDECERTYN